MTRKKKREVPRLMQALMSTMTEQQFIDGCIDHVKGIAEKLPPVARAAFAADLIDVIDEHTHRLEEAKSWRTPLTAAEILAAEAADQGEKKQPAPWYSHAQYKPKQPAEDAESGSSV